MRNYNFVYICSPYHGKNNGREAENVEKARNYCRDLITKHPDLVPIAPHLYFPQFLSDSDPVGRAYGLAKGIELLDLCGCIAVAGLGRVEPSAGMAAEIKYAEDNGIPILDLDELVATPGQALKMAGNYADAPTLRPAT